VITKDYISEGNVNLTIGNLLSDMVLLLFVGNWQFIFVSQNGIDIRWQLSTSCLPRHFR
jgi:hypothetical protein